MKTTSLVVAFISFAINVTAQNFQITEVFDGSINNGNQHFYFLPPLVSNSSFSGIFDNSLEPDVKIYKLIDGLCIDPPIAQFQFGVKNEVKLTDDHYQLNWKTKDYNLDPNGFYQVKILVNNLLMGFITISGNVENRTIPIKFRLEEGSANWGAIGPEGGTIEFANDIIFDIPSGAVDYYQVIGIDPLPEVELQALLDERDYRSSSKIVLGGFLGKPDGMTFNVPVKVKMPINPTSKIPIQVKMSLNPNEYWITPTELIYDPETDIIEFTMVDFSGHSSVEIVGAELDLPDGCSSGRIRVVVESSDFQGGQGCQIVGESVEVTFIDCGSVTQIVRISETTPECDELGLTVEILTTSVKVCRSKQLQASVKDINGNEWSIPLTWSIQASPNAIIDQNNVITGLEEGSLVVKATTQDPRIWGFTTVNVLPPPPIIISPASLNIEVDDEETLLALDETGQPYSCEGDEGSLVTWSSQDSDIAKVDSETGTVKGVSDGETTITATLGSATGSAQVIVEGGVCNSEWAYIDTDPYWEEGLVGKSFQSDTTVMIYDININDYIESECLGTDYLWYSNNNSVATVTQSGLITFTGAGSTYITVELKNNPEVQGFVSVYVWFSECDKDGDGTLDRDMSLYAVGCCGPQPPLPNLCTLCDGHSPEACENYGSCCPCGPCSVYTIQTLKCKTGETRTSGCIPSGCYQTWGGELICNTSKNASIVSADNPDNHPKIDKFEAETWPNPSDGLINISITTPNRLDKVNIQVIDFTGKRVHFDKFDWDQQYKFGENLQSGVYFVKIKQGNNTKVLRVIKY